ncbi:FAS1-like dehydratase domain-containing protein [Pusillimonas noertemannii]|uniref:FAS1-like dehydratase domain-containing protein n=1 Tax=Pusillimonas noertemannii TaxID=305977 RepID=UPI00333E9774
MTREIDIQHLKEWEGRTTEQHDVLTAAPIAALAATLDIERLIQYPPSTLPSCWHWLYCLPTPRQSELASDGHAQKGGFLPPVPLPRRMWAGSRLSFLQPLPIGSAIRRRSSVMNVDAKHGRSGHLVFVLVRHELRSDAGLALIEEQDIVYREPPAPSSPAPTPELAPADAEWEQEIVPTDMLLFRYSALTFNTHRIHYSLPYCTEVENYPGLVVHGPLIATLLLELVTRQYPDKSLSAYSFRAVSPLFDTHPFFVCGKPSKNPSEIILWARSHTGNLAMTARVRLRD